MFKRSLSRSQKVDISRATRQPSRPTSAPTTAIQIARRDARKHVWSECTIMLPSGGTRIGVLLDVSASGARVRFRTRGALPNCVGVVAPRLSLKRTATVVWQDTFTAGLQFRV